jgi:hypothetical protein
MARSKRARTENAVRPQAEGCASCRAIDQRSPDEPYPCRRSPHLPTPRRLMKTCADCGATVVHGTTLAHGTVQWHVPALFPVTGAPHACALARAVGDNPDRHLLTLIQAGQDHHALWKTLWIMPPRAPDVRETS